MGRSKTSTVIAFLAAMYAATPAYAGNAAPLGLELNVATRQAVQKEIGSRARLQDMGVNSYSEGRQLNSDGNGLGVDGVKEIAFIFDKNDKLAAVIMTFPKDAFKETLRTLSEKYKVIERRVPFVGDAYAKFRQGDSIIEMNAPHLSFDMTLMYITSNLDAQAKKKDADAASAKARNQASKL